jgi:hypothetical protein
MGEGMIEINHFSGQLQGIWANEQKAAWLILTCIPCKSHDMASIGVDGPPASDVSGSSHVPTPTERRMNFGRCWAIERYRNHLLIVFVDES